jgi:uncharacterized membrane-anchored protein
MAQPTDQVLSHISPPSHRQPWWQFALPLALQLGIVASIAAQSAYTFFTGQAVTLKTAPVDPYSWLTGYSQTLQYDISNLETLKQLPGWDAIAATVQQQPVDQSAANYTNFNGTNIYVIMQAQTQPDQPWQAIAVAAQKPHNLPQNQVALRGKIVYNTVQYGLETYYMPEARKDEVNQIIRENQTKQPAIVDIKVDHNGKAVPVQIKVGGKVLQF